jgi:hypothetical protein
MYGLSWCELGRDLSEESPLKKRAVTESLKSLANLESDYCKSNFDKDLSLPFGAFYFSWTNYLRAKILSLPGNFQARKDLANKFDECCNKISAAINKSPSPFLESYLNRYWPADILPGIASLSIYDKLFSTRYTKTIEDWFTKIDTLQVINKCMFPHSVDSKGILIQNERGSSMGLILILLPDISESVAHNRLPDYRQKFLTDFFSLPTIREYAADYEEDEDEVEDIDSGPVIFGNGSVATIIGAGVFKRHGLVNVSNKMFQSIECFGFPYTNNKNKKYLAGMFPMADFFIAWSKSQNIPANITVNSESDSKWRLTFHFASFIVIGLLMAMILKLMKKQKD